MACDGNSPLRGTNDLVETEERSTGPLPLRIIRLRLRSGRRRQDMSCDGRLPLGGANNAIQAEKGAAGSAAGLVVRLWRGSERLRRDLPTPVAMSARIVARLAAAKRYVAESEDGSGPRILILLFDPSLALAIALEIKQVFSAGRHTNPFLLTRRFGGRFRPGASFCPHECSGG
jgi:hypothetical protein